MKNLFSMLFVACVLTIAASAQTPSPTIGVPSADDDVVKITTKLVQFDAVVTDEGGNQIKDLTVADFEILQDGKPQTITNFSYVNTEISAQSSPKTAIRNGESVVLSPPVRARPGNNGRIVTFIVDDGNCTASVIGMTAAREALENFVAEQMLPNDSVAIYQTRGGSGLLQQYTSDKNQLLRVARRIRWLPPKGSCVSRNGDFFEPAREESKGISVRENSTGASSGQDTFETPTDRGIRQRIEDAARDDHALGTIGLIDYVVRGLAKVNGRKVVFLLSDGLPLRTRERQSRRALDALRVLTDSANRASVVFNTIDARGIISNSPLGIDEKSAGVFEQRAEEIRNTRDGLAYLANETGGEFYFNRNRLQDSIRESLGKEKGYYLIGYEPDGETFKNKDFNKVEIKLKRSDLKITSRGGFTGKTDESIAPKKRSADSDLYEAMSAPLPRAGLNIRLSAFFVNDPAQGNVVRSLVHLDGNELTFSDEPDGFKKVSLDVAAVTLNEKNEPVDEFNRAHTFKVEAAAIPFIKQNGIIYTTDVPVKKAGNYNFRLAVRDKNSKLLGSAGQMIEIPDLKKSKIFLSGLTVSATDANGKFALPSAVKPENALSPTASAAVPAIRRFRPNTILAYAYTLYNARLDKTTRQPKLTVQVNLYFDGKIIAEGVTQPIQPEQMTDQARIGDYGYLRLNANIERGDYALQVNVKDLVTNETTSQWIDFEVEN